MSRHGHSAAAIHSVRTLWEEFATKVLDSEIGECKREESRKIFYSGFFTALAWAGQVAGEEGKAREEIIGSAWQECAEFFSPPRSEIQPEDLL